LLKEEIRRATSGFVQVWLDGISSAENQYSTLVPA